MLRINAVNFKQQLLKQEQDIKPSPLYSIFSNNNHRDIVSLIAAYASADDLSQVKMSSKAAYFNINKWLDQSFTNPDRLLEILGKLDKLQIASLLQKYFSHGSPYLTYLESHPNQDSCSLYACYALVADINDLEVEDLERTLEWMRTQHIPQHLISSIQVILGCLNPPEDDEDERELGLNEIIALHPLAYINLRGANLREEWLRNVDLRGANLQHTILNRAQLSRANLTGASLQHADMANCTANDTNFTGANLQFSKLDKAYVECANFNNADLRYASLRHTDLSHATLNDATLQGANFKRAELVETDAIHANFSKSNLTGANLQFANLSEATLNQTKLAGSTFFSTDLSHATLQNVVEKPSSMPFTRFTLDNEGEKPPKARKLF